MTAVPILFEIVPVNGLHIEDGRYWTIIYDEWRGKQIESVTEFKYGFWHIGKHCKVVSVVRPYKIDNLIRNFKKD